MMMYKFLLQELYANNLCSLLDFTIPFHEGITVISGKNGSGKSSIIAAIQYTLFGRAGKKTKSDLQSWLTNEIPVSKVALSRDKDTLVVSRGKSLSFTINGKKEKVREHPIFRDLVDGLKYSFLTPDFVSFVDLKPAERREVLINLIPDLSFIRSNVLPYMSELSTRVANVRQKTENRFHALSGEIIGILEDIKVLEINKKNAKETIAELEEKLKSLEEQRVAVEKELSEVDSEYVNSLKEKLQELQNRKSMLETEYKELQKRQNELSRLVGLVKGLQDKLVSLQATIKDAQTSVKELRCKWCGSKIGIEQATRIEERSKNVKKEAERIKNQIKSYMEKLKEKKNLDLKIEEIESDIKKVLKEIDEVKHDLLVVEDIQKRLNDKKDIYEKTKSAYERVNKILESSSTIKDLKSKLRRLSKEKKYVEKKLSVLESREQMFSNISDFLRRDIVDIYVKNVCAVLESATNEILEPTGFEVSITPEAGRIHIAVDGVKFYQKSTGEQQRVRIATTLAFAALANRSGFIIIDELFDSGLDEDGIGFLVESISRWLRKRFDQVIIISHRQDLVALLDPDCVVELRNEGGQTILVR